MTTRPAAATGPRPGPVLLAVLAVALLLGLGTGLAVHGLGPARGEAPRAPERPAPAASLVADRLEVRAARLLREWDRRRAAAWASTDPAALIALYPAGSRLARADRQALRRWRERGLRLEGAVPQLLAVRVLDHPPGRFRLQVVDRLRGGWAVSDAGGRRALPRDGPRTTEVVLARRPDGGWVVAEAGASAGPSAARR